VQSATEHWTTQAADFPQRGEVRFPTLRDLTIRGNVSSQTLITLLSPTSLPSLRSLGLSSVDAKCLQELFSYEPTTRLMDQIDTLTLEMRRPDCNSIALAALNPSKILFQINQETSFESYKQASASVRHLCIFSHRLLPLFATFLEQHETLPLRTLRIDIAFKPSNQPYGRDKMRGIPALVAICRRRNIELLYQIQKDFK